MSYLNKKTTNNNVERQPNAWELRAKEIAKLRKAFMDGFKFSHLMQQAIAGGYENDMRNYVDHVAEIQAQMITGDKVGYNSVLLGLKDKEQANRFLEEQRQLCAYGSIEVRIPTSIIDWWLLKNKAS